MRGWRESCSSELYRDFRRWFTRFCQSLYFWRINYDCLKKRQERYVYYDRMGYNTRLLCNGMLYTRFRSHLYQTNLYTTGEWLSILKSRKSSSVAKKPAINACVSSFISGAKMLYERACRVFCCYTTARNYKAALRNRFYDSKIVSLLAI